jgi:hypothetical protein
LRLSKWFLAGVSGWPDAHFSGNSVNQELRTENQISLNLLSAFASDPFGGSRVTGPMC